MVIKRFPECIESKAHQRGHAREEIGQKKNEILLSDGKKLRKLRGAQRYLSVSF